MITIIKTDKIGVAMFEAMKHGVPAEYLGDGHIELDTAAIEKITLLVNKLNATIVSEEDIVPLTPYVEKINGQSTYDVYRRLA